MYGDLYIIFICYNIFALYAKISCDQNKKVLPTLEKMSFVFYFNTTDTKQRTVCHAHTVQSHPHPEKKELSAFQPIPSVTLRSGDKMPQLMGISLKTGSKMPLSSGEELLLLLTTV